MADATFADEGHIAAEEGVTVSKLARLTGWKLSLFLVALGGGAAVSMVGVIDLVWRLRLVLSGLGAVCFVVWVFLAARRDRPEDGWLGS